MKTVKTRIALMILLRGKALGKSERSKLPACLEPYYDGGQVLHPLLTANCWEVLFDRRLVRKLRAREEKLEEARKNRNWNEFLLLHEPSWRLEALIEIKEFLELSLFFKLAGELWNSPELICPHSNILTVYQVIGDGEEEEAKQMMTHEEFDLLEKSDAEFEIFRSHGSNNRMGICWTLRKDVALDFAKQINYSSVSSLIVGKGSVSCFFNRRGEDEIILRLSKMHLLETAIKTERIKGGRSL